MSTPPQNEVLEAETPSVTSGNTLEVGSPGPGQGLDHFTASQSRDTSPAQLSLNTTAQSLDLEGAVQDGDLMTAMQSPDGSIPAHNTDRRHTLFSLSDSNSTPIDERRNTIQSVDTSQSLDLTYGMSRRLTMGSLKGDILETPTSSAKVKVRFSEIVDYLSRKSIFSASVDRSMTPDVTCSTGSLLSWATGLKSAGLGVVTTSFLLVGEMAGTGILVLPHAIHNTGSGLLIITLFCFASGYNGTRLGKCWIMIMERYPDEYEEHVRYPYPAIAFRALGKPMQHLTSAAIEVTLFGVVTVFLRIMSQNIHSLLLHTGHDFSSCYIVLILSLPLFLLGLLGTPKHFWPIGVFASLSTIVAAILILVGISEDPKAKDTYEDPDPIAFKPFFLGFGAIAFTFGGVSTFPTIQQDMRRPHHFSKSVITSYSVLMIIYAPVAIMGYIYYGGAVSVNILKSISQHTTRIVVEVLVTIHLFTAFVIVLNPLSQQVEEKLKIPDKFCWQRVLVRCGVMVAVVFVAETIPHFGPLLNLIGGSTISFLTFIAPSIYYVQLCRQRIGMLSIGDYILNMLIVLVGVFGGLAATYSAIQELIHLGRFKPPCYINITAADTNY